MTYHVHYTIYNVYTSEMFEWKPCFLHQQNESTEQIVAEEMVKVQSFAFWNTEQWIRLTYQIHSLIRGFLRGFFRFHWNTALLYFEGEENEKTNRNISKNCDRTENLLSVLFLVFTRVYNTL